MSEADGADDESWDGADGGSHGTSSALKPEMQGKLGEKLKEAYADVLNEPVPDRFLELLAQLDSKGAPPSERTHDLDHASDKEEDAE